jgi:hypothetical protein
MQILKGTAVTLGTETVANVLVGLPSADGKEYTLGIPKGDAHDWADRKLGFFGRRWRTLGFPEEGEPQNIPLAWGKNVRVRLLETSGSVTVYDGRAYVRHIFGDVLLTDLRGVTVTAIGAQPADAVTLSVWSCSSSDGYRIRTGDIIVSGEQDFVFDTATQQTASASMTAFRAAFPEMAVVSGVSAALNGRKYDFTITAR